MTLSKTKKAAAKKGKEEKPEKKISQNVTLGESVFDYVEEERKPENDNRTFSNMVETLILDGKKWRETQKKAHK